MTEFRKKPLPPEIASAVAQADQEYRTFDLQCRGNAANCALTLANFYAQAGYVMPIAEVMEATREYLTFFKEGRLQ